MDPAMSDFMSAAGVFAASALLGLVKRHTSALDARVGRVVKPLQPVLITLAGLALPFATAALGIAPVDASVFVTAPTATIAAVTLREAAGRLRARR